MQTPSASNPSFKAFLEKLQEQNSRGFATQLVQLKADRENVGKDNDKREEQLDAVILGLKEVKDAITGKGNSALDSGKGSPSTIKDKSKPADDTDDDLEKTKYQGFFKELKSGFKFFMTDGLSEKPGYGAFQEPPKEVEKKEREAKVSSPRQENPEADNITSTGEIEADAAKRDLELSKQMLDTTREQLNVLKEIRDALAPKTPRELTEQKSTSAPSTGSGGDGGGGSGFDLPGFGGGKGGTLGKVGRGLMTAGRAALPYAAAAGVAVAGGAAVDYGLGKLGVGKDKEGNDLQVDTAQDDANWAKMSTGQKIESGLARGIEKTGSALFLGNVSKEAQATRIKKETDYLNKNAPGAATKKALAPTPETVVKKDLSKAEKLSGIKKEFQDSEAKEAAARDKIKEFEKANPFDVQPKGDIESGITPGKFKDPKKQEEYDKLQKDVEAQQSQGFQIKSKYKKADIGENVKPMSAAEAAQLNKQAEEANKAGRHPTGKPHRTDFKEGEERGLRESEKKRKYADALLEKGVAREDIDVYKAEDQYDKQIEKELREKDVTGGPGAKNPAAPTPEALSPNQILRERDIARTKEKAALVAPTGDGSGTLQSGQIPVVEKKAVDTAALGEAAAAAMGAPLMRKASDEDAAIYGKAYDNARAGGAGVAEAKTLAREAVQIAKEQKAVRDGATVPEARAAGGPVEDGADYIVGEKGPELFMPFKDGVVLPNDVSKKVAGGKIPLEGGGIAFANDNISNYNQLSDKAKEYQKMRLGLDSLNKIRGPGGSNVFEDISPEVKEKEAKFRKIAAKLSEEISPAEKKFIDDNLTDEVAPRVDLNAKYNSKDGFDVIKTSTENADMAREASGKGGANNTVVSNNVSSNNTTKFVPIKSSPRAENTGSALDRYTSRIAVY